MSLSNVKFLDECRHLEFRAAQVFHGHRLMNHVISRTDVTNKEFCGVLCFMEPKCVSYNLMTKNENGKHNCELNNATYEENKRDVEENPNYVYRGAKVKAFQKIKLTMLKVFLAFDFLLHVYLKCQFDALISS